MAIQCFGATLKGISPLTLGAPVLANKSHDLYGEYEAANKAAAVKKLSTTERQRRLEAVRDIEFMAKLHYVEKLGPVIPNETIHAAFQEAATAVRLGATMRRAFRIILGPFPIKYKGPRTPAAMLKEGNRKKFLHTVIVKTQGAQKYLVPATYPCFAAGWEVDIAFTYDDTQIDHASLVGILIYLGKCVGLGSFRQKGFGRFEVSNVIKKLEGGVTQLDALADLKAAIANRKAEKVEEDEEEESLEAAQ